MRPLQDFPPIQSSARCGSGVSADVSKLPLQPLHGAADARFRLAERTGGSRKAPALDALQKISQSFQFMIGRLSSKKRNCVSVQTRFLGECATLRMAFGRPVKADPAQVFGDEPLDSPCRRDCRTANQ